MDAEFNICGKGPHLNGQDPFRDEFAGADAGSVAASRISEEQLAGLPMNGRSYSQLATLQAGVSDTSSASGSRGGRRGAADEDRRRLRGADTHRRALRILEYTSRKALTRIEA